MHGFPSPPFSDLYYESVYQQHLDCPNYHHSPAYTPKITKSLSVESAACRKEKGYDLPGQVFGEKKDLSPPGISCPISMMASFRSHPPFSMATELSAHYPILSSRKHRASVSTFQVTFPKPSWFIRELYLFQPIPRCLLAVSIWC